MSDVKIITGYSEKGGSTSALIQLTNALNSAGVKTTMYGPHSYHIDKVTHGELSTSQLTVKPTDTLITHFIQLPKRPAVKKVILTCHEKWWFKVGEIKKHWDTAVFLHDAHREYHKEYKGDYTIIPNFKPDLKSKDKPELDLVAGVIGSIEDRKQTHISIKRALDDGCTTVKLFGNISDPYYYRRYVMPYVDSRVEVVGFCSDLQEIYDSIGRVYHSSKGEVACLVKDECYLTNTKFFGGPETENEVSTLTNEEIINKWRDLIEL